MLSERSDRLDTPTPPRWSDGFAVAGIAFLILVYTGVQALWGPDGRRFFQQTMQGVAQDERHVLYIPWTRFVVWVGEFIQPVAEVAPLRMLTTASACTAAVFVFGVHRAASTLGATRAQAFAVAAAAAGTPSVVFFGSIFEVQGFLLAFIGITWWAAAHASNRPSELRIVLLGSTTGLAALAHATGNLLTVLCAVFVLTGWAHHRRMPCPRRLIGMAALGAVAHSCCYMFVIWAVGLEVPVGHDLGVFSFDISEQHRAFGEIVHREFLLAYLPTGLAAAAVLRDRGARASWLWMQPLALGLIVFTWDLLSRYGIAGSEHGAYLLGLAFPFAWWTMRGLGWKLCAAAGAIGLIAGVCQLPPPQPHNPAAAAAARIVADNDPVFLCADPGLADAFLLQVPHAYVIEGLDRANVAFLLPGNEALFDAWFDASHADGSRKLLLDRATVEGIQHWLPKLATHLQEHYRLRPVGADTPFSGILVERP